MATITKERHVEYLIRQAIRHVKMAKKSPDPKLMKTLAKSYLREALSKL